MLEHAIIFSKESQSIILTSLYGEVDPKADAFKDSLEKIREIAVKLEKGVFKLDLANNGKTMIVAIKNLSIALTFNKIAKEELMNFWESVALEILKSFDKIYVTKDPAKILAFKDTMDEIIQWNLKEQSPIDKMKEAFW
ncbi:MAG: hypothetical protein ACTSUA_03320 [Candidatus Heimdallarchaeota archaeon]